MKETILKGKVWILIDKAGEIIDDIDTDQIFHNRYLAITDINEMGKYAFDNLENWKDFSEKAEPGDIIITGRNFGAGSSRQQAVDCFISLKGNAIIAESFGAIYKRNAINSGFPILIWNELRTAAENGKIENRDEIEINLETSKVKNLTKNTEFEVEQFSKVQME
ncbi:3-isopropylmalate dehydratase, partial [Candidatus Dependentiae bacterium]|nr:3-isopropylmalate dehydratase [Candidatus Dependentiae bacterium]